MLLGSCLASAPLHDEIPTGDDDDSAGDDDDSAGDDDDSAGDDDDSAVGDDDDDDDDSASASLALGTVSSLGSCDDSIPTQAPAGTTCERLEVSCPGLVPLEAELLSIRPAAGTSVRGTVLLGRGGPGTDYYPPQLADQISQLGFVVHVRRWTSSWADGTAGLAGSACRYATLITWVAEQPDHEGALCASGNSGGAGELAYALARYGRGDILDQAVLSSGPPFSRLDWGCAGDAAWQSTCEASVPDGVCTEETIQCGFSGNNLSLLDGAFDGTPCADGGPVDLLRGGSVLSEDALLSYPQTLVHFLFGTDDCTISVPLGWLYADAIASETQMHVVAAGHSLFGTATGQAAIRNALDAGCEDRHPGR